MYARKHGFIQPWVIYQWKKVIHNYHTNYHPGWFKYQTWKSVTLESVPRITKTASTKCHTNTRIQARTHGFIHPGWRTGKIVFPFFRFPVLRPYPAGFTRTRIPDIVRPGSEAQGDRNGPGSDLYGSAREPTTGPLRAVLLQVDPRPGSARPGPVAARKNRPKIDARTPCARQNGRVMSPMYPTG